MLHIITCYQFHNVWLIEPCEWGSWSSTWSSCDKDCLGGKRTKTRNINKKAQFDGVACDHKICSSTFDRNENCGIKEEKCNFNPCPGSSKYFTLVKIISYDYCLILMFFNLT